MTNFERDFEMTHLGAHKSEHWTVCQVLSNPRDGGGAMSEMIERVARALWTDRYPEGEWDSDERRDYMGHARAAIEAMREPSDQMIDAVYKNEFIQAMRPEDLYAAWESMIDTALGEKP